MLFTSDILSYVRFLHLVLMSEVQCWYVHSLVLLSYRSTLTRFACEPIYDFIFPTHLKTFKTMFSKLLLQRLAWMEFAPDFTQLLIKLFTSAHAKVKSYTRFFPPQGAGSREFICITFHKTLLDKSCKINRLQRR